MKTIIRFVVLVGTCCVALNAASPTAFLKGFRELEALNKALKLCVEKPGAKWPAWPPVVRPPSIFDSVPGPEPKIDRPGKLNAPPQGLASVLDLQPVNNALGVKNLLLDPYFAPPTGRSKYAIEINSTKIDYFKIDHFKIVSDSQLQSTKAEIADEKEDLINMMALARTTRDSPRRGTVPHAVLDEDLLQGFYNKLSLLDAELDCVMAACRSTSEGVLRQGGFIRMQWDPQCAEPLAAIEKLRLAYLTMRQDTLAELLSQYEAAKRPLETYLVETRVHSRLAFLGRSGVEVRLQVSHRLTPDQVPWPRTRQGPLCLRITGNTPPQFAELAPATDVCVLNLLPINKQEAETFRELGYERSEEYLEEGMKCERLLEQLPVKRIPRRTTGPGFDVDLLREDVAHALETCDVLVIIAECFQSKEGNSPGGRLVVPGATSTLDPASLPVFGATVFGFFCGSAGKFPATAASVGVEGEIYSREALKLTRSLFETNSTSALPLGQILKFGGNFLDKHKKGAFVLASSLGVALVWDFASEPSQQENTDDAAAKVEARAKAKAKAKASGTGVTDPIMGIPGI